MNREQKAEKGMVGIFRCGIGNAPAFMTEALASENLPRGYVVVSLV